MISKKAMIDFLSTHFMYDTMNSWNGAKSYAANVKLRNLKIPHDLDDAAYECLDHEQAYDDVNALMDDFAREYDYSYQAGFNGRSGGYIVLYVGGRKKSEYKSYCQACGQRNFEAVPNDKRGVCGRCGKIERVNREFYETYTQPGRGITNDAEELAEMETDELTALYKVVKRFDKLVEDCKAAYIDYVRSYVEQKPQNDYAAVMEAANDAEARLLEPFDNEKCVDDDLQGKIMRNVGSIKKLIADKL